MKVNKQLQVIYKDRLVGKLAKNDADKVAFQYDEGWLNGGFSISPFSIPLRKDVFVPTSYNFNGLFGVFADSLPDAWGRLVLDRKLKSCGINPSDINMLDRLAIVGQSGMGALEYYPEYNLGGDAGNLSVEELAEECKKVLEGKDPENIDELFAGCGSSGGARPKAFIRFDDEDWIVKFHYSLDSRDSGLMEYNYSLLAKECGIDMPKTRLIPSEKCSGYFAVKRFDRPKVHMISAAALLEIDFERSSADYKDLLKLTNIITNGNSNDLNDMFRRMCFNVYAGNQDDHLKNFSFLYDDSVGVWHLSPAYDLTRITTGYGEHTTTVNGKGKNITSEDLIKTGTGAGLSKAFCIETEELICGLCSNSGDRNIE